MTEIGEAAKAVPDEILERIEGVPWKAVKGMRDKVLHDYPAVDLDILWETMRVGVPLLAERIEATRSVPGAAAGRSRTRFPSEYGPVD